MNRLIASLRSNVVTARRVIAIGAAAPDRLRRRRAALHYFGENQGQAEIEPTAVETLQRDGFVPWTLQSAVVEQLSAAFAALCDDRARGQADTVKRSTGKRFFQETLTERELAKRPPLVDAALDRRLLLSVASAMGMVPHLESIEIYVSNPEPGLTASQLWHRDVNDKVTIKLFVYLNEVGAKNGPFSFIAAPDAVRVPRNLGHYMSDELIDTFLPRTAWRKVEGTVGTAFLVDTSRCLHFGSRCEEPRIAYVATYSSGIKFTKYSRAWQGILGERAARLDKLQRMVCGLEPIA